MRRLLARVFLRGSVFLTGCHGLDCAVAGLHGYQCDPGYPVACTPAARQMGSCKDVPVKQVQGNKS